MVPVFQGDGSQELTGPLQWWASPRSQGRPEAFYPEGLVLQRALPLNLPTEDLSGLHLGVHLLIMAGINGVIHCVTANLATSRIQNPAEAFVLEFYVYALHS